MQKRTADFLSYETDEQSLIISAKVRNRRLKPTEINQLVLKVYFLDNERSVFILLFYISYHPGECAK